MVVKIKNIQDNHKKGIYSLIDRVNQADDLGYSLEEQWLDYIIKEQSESVFIGVKKSEVLGLATCMINEMDSSHAMINIVVDPQHRNQGIGSRLYDEVISYAKDRSVKVVEAYIKKRLNDSLKFSEKRGFETILYVWKLDLDVNKTKLELIKPNDSLEFRQASLNDNKSYSHIINHSFDDMLDENALARILQDPSVRVYMLELDGQAIGSVTMQIRKNLSTGYIYDVAVMEKYRRRGLGGYMLEKCIEELRLKDIDTATLTVAGENKGALGLYHKLGFEEVDMDILVGISSYSI